MVPLGQAGTMTNWTLQNLKQRSFAMPCLGRAIGFALFHLEAKEKLMRQIVTTQETRQGQIDGLEVRDGSGQH